MSSLYNRASPPQRKVFRIVEGAVKNAADAHPQYRVPRNFARSIAKRATGTLTAQWPDVLAAQSPSDNAGSLNFGKARQSVSRAIRRTSGEGRVASRSSPLKSLHIDIGNLAGAARKNGEVGRSEAFVEALRLISKFMARPK